VRRPAGTFDDREATEFVGHGSKGCPETVTVATAVVAGIDRHLADDSPCGLRLQQSVLRYSLRSG
jgi:hypothetical protein